VGFVDLHSHVLYGLDDGSPDAETSSAMLDGLAAIGISEQCLTPHQKASQYLPAWDDVEETFAEIEAARKPHHPTLRLGAENMWDDVFRARLGTKTIPHYRGTKAFLVEIPPPIMPPNMIDELFKLRMSTGSVAVLAHPERYHALWEDAQLAVALRRVCAFAIDLGALGGFHGKREMKAARQLVENGLATCVATDAHTVGDLQQSLAGLAWLDKKVGHATTVRLFDHAPRELLAGNMPD
jgi:protein-tyrosine phosphatase